MKTITAIICAVLLPGVTRVFAQQISITINAKSLTRQTNNLADSTDKNVLVVDDFYSNGKYRLSDRPFTPTERLNKADTVAVNYPNGNRRLIEVYNKKTNTCFFTRYYPNGKVYHVTSMKKGSRKKLLIECRDPDGTLLAQNGNGTWIKYDDDFKIITKSGPVVNGLKEGEWKGAVANQFTFAEKYHRGVLVLGTSVESSGVQHKYLKDTLLPGMRGGLRRFHRILHDTLDYLQQARQDNYAAHITVSFIIEKDGTMKNFKILRTGVGYQEYDRYGYIGNDFLYNPQYPNAGRVSHYIPVKQAKFSYSVSSGDLATQEALIENIAPRWSPGSLYGIPQRVKYIVTFNYRAPRSESYTAYPDVTYKPWLRTNW